ncbi:MAG: VanZ family protein [Pseudomonadota bacterium]
MQAVPLSHLYRIALVVTMLAISYLATSQLDHPLIPDTNDKLLHAAAFLVLALLADFAFPRLPWNWRKFSLLLAYGLLLEIAQYFIPNRCFSLADLSADALGLLLYPILLPWLLKLPVKRPEI